MGHTYLGKPLKTGLVVRFTDKGGKCRAGIVLAYVPKGEEPVGPSVVLADFTSLKPNQVADPNKTLFLVENPRSAERMSLDPVVVSLIRKDHEQFHVVGVECLDEGHKFGTGWAPRKVVKQLSIWFCEELRTSPDATHAAIVTQLDRQN